MTHATTWMHFRCIALSNSNRFPMGIYFMISFIWYSEKGKIIRIETRSVVAKSGSGGKVWQQRGFMRECFGCWNGCILLLVVIRLCAFVLTHRTRHPQNRIFWYIKITKGTKEIEQITCAFCEVECKELDRPACKPTAGIRNLISSAGFCSFNCSDTRGLESADPGILRAE